MFGFQCAEQGLLGAQDLHSAGRLLGQVEQRASMGDQPRTHQLAHQHLRIPEVKEEGRQSHFHVSNQGKLQKEKLRSAAHLRTAAVTRMPPAWFTFKTEIRVCVQQRTPKPGKARHWFPTGPTVRLGAMADMRLRR